jgi:hypothetical protein
MKFLCCLLLLPISAVAFQPLTRGNNGLASARSTVELHQQSISSVWRMMPDEPAPEVCSAAPRMKVKTPFCVSLFD